MVSNVSPWGANRGMGSYFFEVVKKGEVIRGGGRAVIRGMGSYYFRVGNFVKKFTFFI